MAPKSLHLALISTLAALVVGQNATVCSSQATKTISSQEDADSIAACPTFTGSISLADGPLYSAVELKGVKEITGTLTTHDWNKVTASSLERIGGSFENHDSYTVTMDFPKLAYVGGGISFTESNQMRPGLQHVLMPSLTTVDGDFIVYGNHYLGELQAPNLQRVNGLLKVSENLYLNGLTLDKLETAAPGGIVISGSLWNGVSLASIQDVHPRFSIATISPGNCTEWEALREPGGPLATTEEYNCQPNCKYFNYDGTCSEFK